jgi:predicted RNA-binding protein with EMAP domain
LNRNFNFGLRSLVVDVHDTTLTKGSGIVSVAVLFGPPRTLNAEVSAGEG